MTTPKKNNNRTAKKAARSSKKAPHPRERNPRSRNKTTRPTEKAPYPPQKASRPKKTAPSPEKTAPPEKVAGPWTKISPASKKVARPAKITRPAAASERATRPIARTAREKLSILRPSGQKDDSFFDLVHEVARQIPPGRVTSYGAIAACLGTRLSARMVGWAMLSAHTTPNPVPAHRVVNRNGLLSGRHHYNPPEKMQQLLEQEGVLIKNDQVVDFKKLFWDPATEL